MSAAFGQPRKHPETHGTFLGMAQVMVASARQCLANLVTNLMPGRLKLTPNITACLATQITVFICESEDRLMCSYFEHNLDDYIYVNILTLHHTLLDHQSLNTSSNI